MIGGVAAVLAGAPMTTFDLDVLVPRDEENDRRLLTVLLDLEARYQDSAGRVLQPTAERLESQRMHLLVTRLGRLDILRETPDYDYAALTEEALHYDLDGGTIQALGLEALIRIKESVDRPKDRLTVHLLRQLLDIQQNDEV